MNLYALFLLVRPLAAVLLFFYRPFLFASLDEDVAEAKSMHTTLLGVLFMFNIALFTHSLNAVLRSRPHPSEWALPLGYW